MSSRVAVRSKRGQTLTDAPRKARCFTLMPRVGRYSEGPPIVWESVLGTARPELALGRDGWVSSPDQGGYLCGPDRSVLAR